MSLDGSTNKPACLADDPGYANAEKRLEFLKKYWYALALTPFSILLLIIFMWFANSSAGTLFDALVLGTLGWALAICGYCLWLIIRVLAARCPRCGWRFGLGEQCSSCGSQRHAQVRATA